MLKPLDPEVLAQAQEEFKESLSPEPIRALNVDNVAALREVREFEYPKGSGNVYDVPRVPYPDGIQLNDLFYRIMQSKKYESPVQLPIYERQLSQIIKIMWKLTTPRGRVARFRKRLGLMKNPFYEFSTEAEIAELIAFFLVRRMMSSITFHYPANSTHRPRQ